MGLDGADGCGLKQPNGDFSKEKAQNNITNRIPTPAFGAGLIESIDDSTIDANVKYQAGRVFDGGVSVPQARLNIIQPFHANGVQTQEGQENRNGNDGTIAR